MAYNIVTIVGSIRKESLSLKIANALAKLAPASLQLDVTTLQGISFFNQDLEGPRRRTGSPSARSCRSRTACCS